MGMIPITEKISEKNEICSIRIHYSRKWIHSSGSRSTTNLSGSETLQFDTAVLSMRSHRDRTADLCIDLGWHSVISLFRFNRRRITPRFRQSPATVPPAI